MAGAVVTANANLNANLDINQAFDQTSSALNDLISGAEKNYSMCNPGDYETFTKQIVDAYKDYYRVIVIHDRACQHCKHPKLEGEIKSFNATMVRPEDPAGWFGYVTYKVFLIPEELKSPDEKPIFTVTTSARGFNNWCFAGERMKHDENKVSVY